MHQLLDRVGRRVRYRGRQVRALRIALKTDVIRVVETARATFGEPDIAVANTSNIVPPKGRGFANTADDEFREANEDYVMSVVGV